MTFFKYLLRVSRRTVVFAIFFGIISGASSTGLLALVSAALKSDGLSTGSLLWTFIGLCVVMSVSKYAADLLLVWLGQEAVYNLRLNLGRQILASPLRQLEEIGSHRLLATLTDDITSIINALLFIPTLIINAAIVCGCIVYLGWLSPAVCLAVVIAMIVGIGTYRLPILKGMPFQRLAREGADALFNNFRALTDGTKELKLNSLRREAFLSQVLEANTAELKRNNVKSMGYFLLATSWGHILFFVFIGALLVIVPRVSVGNIGILTACTVTVLYMMTPLEMIMNSVVVISRANVALDKVKALGLKLTAEEGPGKSGVLPAADWETLEVEGVTHSYHREKEDSIFTIGPLYLSFGRGELVFITGGNGSGKTTLVKLLSGLYKPESGQINFDGQPVTAETMENYREHFSVVFSDFYLFENLLGFDSPELDAKALDYLIELQLDRKVQVKDGRLSTIALSQGQRKRLALLVAYLEDRSIYIFDEWAADQDPQFKNIFYYQLLPALKAKGKTVIVVSHDDRYFQIADRIISLTNGQIDNKHSAFATRVLKSQQTPVGVR
ncbi:MAG TPA: cyclic peptide export ABC transporter [Pyrinomonadaceae bacterium]|nr:cyclic peptide export ABC transporter [Pyrinomonadaceae bacterium]